MRRVVFLFVFGVCTQAQPVKVYPRIETGAHAATVMRIDVDEDERFLVSASEDKTARVWDLRSGTLLRILRPPIGDGKEGMLYAIAVSPNRATVAVGGFTGANYSESYPIYVFDRATGEIVRTIRDLKNVTNHLAYSKNGRYLAAALEGKEGIRIYKAGDYSEVGRDAEYADSCQWLEFDNSGRLVTTSYDGFVRLYSSHFRILHKGKAPDGKLPVSSRFSPDGKLIAIGFADTTTVDVLSAEDLSLQYKPQGPPSDEGLKVLWSKDGRTLCAAGRYQPNGLKLMPVLCWGNAGKGRRNTFPVAANTIHDIRALHDGAIAFCSSDGSVGVVGQTGVAQWRAAPDLLDYRVPLPVVRVSSDGNTVEATADEFNGTKLTQHKIVFSVSQQSLGIDSEPNIPLQTAVTTGLSIAGWQNEYHPTLNGRALALDPYEMSRDLAISPNKSSFVLGTEWYIRKFDRQGTQIWSTPTGGVARDVNITPDGRFVIAALGDGTIRWYTHDGGREVLALFVDRDLRRWVAWNPDGFFTFQGGGDALIGYQINRGPDQAGEFVKVEQLREKFYRSDLIASILRPEGAEAILTARNRIGDISKVLSRGLPPEIELISPAENEVDDEYVLQFRIIDRGGGHGRIVYRIDGNEIEGRAAVDITGTGGDTVSRYIPVASGTHELTITPKSLNGDIEGRSQRVRITRRLPVLGSNLYLIAAGISQYSDASLRTGVKFAAADADLIAARFKEQEGKGLYRRVDVVSLPDSRATIANIQSAVAQAAKTVQPDDTFILYLAGHSIAVDGEYYFIPWQSEFVNQQDVLNKSLKREAIQDLLKQTRANKSILILDTCAAGAYLDDPRTKTRERAAIERVAANSGHTVLAASNSKEMATEGYQNHGVFTYVLLQGLEKAQSNENGEILIDSLGTYVRNEVAGIVSKKWGLMQRPLISYVGEPFPIVRKAN